MSMAGRRRGSALQSRSLMRFARSLLVVAVAAAASCARSRTQTTAVIPRPESIEIAPGSPPFVITAQTTIAVPDDERVAAIGRGLAEWIGLAAAEAPPRVVVAQPGSRQVGTIALTLAAATPSREGYQLTVRADGGAVPARQPAGVFYGVQTLRHLLPPFVEFRGVRPDTSRPVAAPAAQIVDRPRFAWRGAMLDVARHFFSVDEVKRYVDLMALYKLNRLHLHLADDQGWRVQIDSWPELTRTGGRTQGRGGGGGVYSKAEDAGAGREA